MPASSAASITARVCARSARAPKLLQPRPTTETSGPPSPSERICMSRTLSVRVRPARDVHARAEAHHDDVVLVHELVVADDRAAAGVALRRPRLEDPAPRGEDVAGADRARASAAPRRRASPCPPCRASARGRRGPCRSPSSASRSRSARRTAPRPPPPRSTWIGCGSYSCAKARISSSVIVCVPWTASSPGWKSSQYLTRRRALPAAGARGRRRASSSAASARRRARGGPALRPRRSRPARPRRRGRTRAPSPGAA